MQKTSEFKWLDLRCKDTKKVCQFNPHDAGVYEIRYNHISFKDRPISST